MSTDYKMEYRLLGETGLKVSVLGLGAMTFETLEETLSQLRCVRKYGVNFIDNAEVDAYLVFGTLSIYILHIPTGIWSF